MSPLKKLARYSASGDGDMSSLLEPPISDGVITRVRLVNFMNHAELDLTLSPTINIITGVNGAGKSSILQGLVLGLGAVAKATKRGTNVSNFVKHSTSKAEIRVHLRNGGKDAYRKDFYGDEIIFERIIMAKPSETGGGGGSTHQIRKGNGDVAYHGKQALEEKKRILEHWNIELDNPTTILQQEEAKVFFKDMNEQNLFDFFTRATLIQSMQEHYGKAQNELKIAQEQLEDNKAALKEKKKEREDWSRKYDDLLELEKREQGSVVVQAQMKMRLAKMRRIAAETKKSVVEKLEAKKSRIQLQAKEKTEIDGALQRQYGTVEMKYRKHDEELEQARRNAVTAKEALSSAKEELEGCETALSVAQEDLAVKAAQLQSLKNANRPASLKSNTDTREAAIKLNRKKEVELKEENEKLKNEIAELGAERELCSGKIDKLEQEDKFTRLAMSSGEADKSRVKAELEELKKGCSTQNLSRFGRNIANLVADIDKSTNFVKKPIGPVGRHIALVGNAAKDSNLADLLETELGGGHLRAFLVNSEHDRKELDRLMKMHFQGCKPPRVCVMKFRGRRDDISSGVVLTSSEMPGILDYLTFDHDDVFNYVVEYVGVESTLVLTQARAQSLFGTPGNVPKNARKAITPDFYKFFPANNGGTYSSYYMEKQWNQQNCLVGSEKGNLQRLEKCLSELSVKIANHAATLENIKTKIDEHSEAKNKVILSITEKRNRWNLVKEQMQQVKHNLTKLSTEESGTDYSAAAEKATADQIEQKKQEVATLKKTKIDLQKVYMATELEWNKARTTWEGLKPNPVQTELTQIEDEIARNKRELSRMSTELAALEKEKRIAQESYKKAQSDADAAEAAAREASQGHDELLVVDTEKSFDELRAEADERKRFLEKSRSEIGLTRAEVNKRLRQSDSECDLLNKQIEACLEHQDMTVRMNAVRKANFKDIRGRLTRNVKRKFLLEMKNHGLRGELQIDYTKRELKVVVSHLQNATADAPPLPLSSLSGGERSKTLVCLIIALWTYQNPPFRCLDEWDVYLDECARSYIEKMIYEHSVSSGYQYIFISPTSSTLNNSSGVVTHVIEKKSA